jgi:hypothetical protein
VHQCAQTLLLRFAGRIQLILGKGHRPLAHAPDAKILIMSAPASFCFRTYARISSGVPVCSPRPVNGSTAVKMRGPGS